MIFFKIVKKVKINQVSKNYLLESKNFLDFNLDFYHFFMLVFESFLV